MSSYFTLVLDTTPPILTLSLPFRVDRGDLLPIVVESNEDLDPGNQSVKLVDKKGNELLVVLSGSGTYWYCDCDVSSLLAGTVSVEVRMADLVGNRTIVRAGFELVEGPYLEAIVDACVRSVYLFSKVRQVVFGVR